MRLLQSSVVSWYQGGGVISGTVVPGLGSDQWYSGTGARASLVPE